MNEAFHLSSPEIEATIYYLSTAEGGRSTPVHSGYRGQFYYDHTNWDAGQEFIGQDQCTPGESVLVIMQTASPESHVGKLFIGKEFEIREGNQMVGQGKITKLIREDFQART